MSENDEKLENGKYRLTLSVDPKIVELVKILAIKNGISLSALFEKWVQEKSDENLSE